MGALNAVILYVLVQTLSEGGASEYRWPILIVAVGSAVLEQVLVHFLHGWLWSLAILLTMVMLIGLLLVLWCGVSRNKALKISGIYMGIRIALAVAIILVFRAA